jgi:very-short-patch-repair endonuclease
MRRTMTEPEVILWSRLRGGGGNRPIFRRQHPIGSIILDFYCAKLKLAIEVDGATHWDHEAQLRDAARDRWLAAQGIHVVRIPASQVYRDIDWVMDHILVTVAALSGGGCA